MHHRRRPLNPIIGIAFAAVIVLAAAAPVLAKEGIEARLDAPIARDTPGGTELLVGLTATVLDGSVTRLIEGTPFYIRLTGPDGDVTRTRTTPDPEMGHYSARILVPASGIAQIEIGIAGSTDLPIMLVGEPIVAGGMTATTAQVPPAVAPEPAVVPAPASAPTVPVADVPEAPAAPVDAPATEAAPAGSAPMPWIGVIAFAVGAALIVGGIIAARRSSRGPRPAAPGRASDA